MKHVLVIPGDGIGPEVILPSVAAIRDITDAIDFEFVESGKKAFEKYGEAISGEVLDKARRADAIFFGRRRPSGTLAIDRRFWHSDTNWIYTPTSGPRKRCSPV